MTDHEQLPQPMGKDNGDFMIRKKVLFLVIIGLFSASAISASTINGEYKGNAVVKVVSGGSELKVEDVPAILYEGRTMVPIYMLKQLGLDLKWIESSYSVDVSLPTGKTSASKVDVDSLMRDLNDPSINKMEYSTDKSGESTLTVTFSFETSKWSEANQTSLKNVMQKAIDSGVTYFAFIGVDNIKAVVKIQDMLDQYNKKISQEEFLTKIQYYSVKEERISGTQQPVTPASTPSSNSSKLSTASDLKNYLTQNYSSVQTSIGEAKFTFNIDENNTTMFAYDYWIQVEYDSQFWFDLQYGNKITSTQREAAKTELKNFQEKLAKDVIEKMPTKKLYGGFYDSWYEYPSLKVGFKAARYYSWTNYDQPDFLSNNKYEDSKPSAFRWYPLIDDKI